MSRPTAPGPCAAGIKDFTPLFTTIVLAWNYSFTCVTTSGPNNTTTSLSTSGSIVLKREPYIRNNPSNYSTDGFFQTYIHRCHNGPCPPFGILFPNMALTRGALGPYPFNSNNVSGTVTNSATPAGCATGSINTTNYTVIFTPPSIIAGICAFGIELTQSGTWNTVPTGGGTFTNCLCLPGSGGADLSANIPYATIMGSHILSQPQGNPCCPSATDNYNLSISFS